MRALQKCMEIVAGTEEQIHQEGVFLELMKQSHPKISLWKRLVWLVQKLPILEPFITDEPKNAENRKKNTR